MRDVPWAVHEGPHRRLNHLTGDCFRVDASDGSRLALGSDSKQPPGEGRESAAMGSSATFGASAEPVRSALGQ